MSEGSANLDDLIGGPGDWRADTPAQVRGLIHEAVPDVDGTWKSRGSPVWESDGILAVGNVHEAEVELTFPQGVHLPDPDGVSDNGVSGKFWRAVDLGRTAVLDERAFVTLVRAAAAHHARQR